MWKVWNEIWEEEAEERQPYWVFNPCGNDEQEEGQKGKSHVSTQGEEEIISCVVCGRGSSRSWVADRSETGAKKVRRF